MKRDHLSECNNFSVPPNDFQEQFCGRCYQKECTRSLANGSFEDRVSNWEDRLFLNPPRMDPKDPRYLPIAGQSFHGIQPSDPGKLADWADTGVPTKTTMVQVPKQIEAVSFVPKTIPLEVPVLPQAQQLNTPNPGKVFLVGAPTSSPTAPQDSWATPAPLKAGEAALKPGGKFRFEDDE